MKYPSLKIALGSIFRLVSVRHRFQHVKLPQCTNFHAGITICTIHVKTRANSPDYQVCTATRPLSAAYSFHLSGEDSPGFPLLLGLSELAALASVPFSYLANGL